MTDPKKKPEADKPTETPPANGPADPNPATELTSASGAIIEPEVTDAVDVGHPAVDSNPREGTSSEQNSADFNDPRHLNPNDPDFAGQGIDRSVYGDAPKADKEG